MRNGDGRSAVSYVVSGEDKLMNEPRLKGGCSSFATKVIVSAGRT